MSFESYEVAVIVEFAEVAEISEFVEVAGNRAKNL